MRQVIKGAMPFQIFVDVNALMDDRDRRDALKLLGIVLLSASTEALGVAAVIPFILFLTDKQHLLLTAQFENLINISPFVADDSFLAFVPFVFALLVFSSIAFGFLVLYYKMHFIMNLEKKLTQKLFAGYLDKDYQWHLNADSTDKLKKVVSETNFVVIGIVSQLINILAYAILSCSIVLVLFLINPSTALFASVTLLLFYAVVATTIKKWLAKLGEERLQANSRRYKVIKDGFGAIDAIKTFGLESQYYDSFSVSAKNYAQTITKSTVMKHAPRYCLEILALSLFLFLLWVVSDNASKEASLAIAGAYAFAGYRLLPYVQQVYGGISQVIFHRSALDEICEEVRSIRYSSFNKLGSKPLDLRLIETLTVSGLFYTHENESAPLLDDLDFEIKRNELIGISGPSGSGKSTLASIFAGLRRADGGLFKLDGTIVSLERYCDIRRAVGYIPQKVYLTDDSIAENIAFGLRADQIDVAWIEQVCKLARIDRSFRMNEFDFIWQPVGENGSRLSGGQIQRIGLARALYKKPDILILDEFTNGLDRAVEREILDNLERLKSHLPIILISHKIENFKNCDRTYELKQGKLRKLGLC